MRDIRAPFGWISLQGFLPNPILHATWPPHQPPWAEQELAEIKLASKLPGCATGEIASPFPMVAFASLPPLLIKVWTICLFSSVFNRIAHVLGEAGYDCRLFFPECRNSFGFA